MGGKGAEKQVYWPEQKLLERIFTDSAHPLECLERQFCAREGMDGCRYGALGLYGRTWGRGEREALFEAFHEIVSYIPLPELTLLLLLPGGDCRRTAEKISRRLQSGGRPRNLAYLDGQFRLAEAREVRDRFEAAAADMFFLEEGACVLLEEAPRRAANSRAEDPHRLRELQREIAAGLARGEEERVRNKLAEFFDAGAQGGPEAFREQCAGLYFRISDALDIPGAGQAGPPEGGPGTSVFRRIEEANHASEITGCITAHIDGLLAARRPAWRNSGCRVAAYVEEYVETHYMEAVSAVDIAAGVGLSVNYMRSVFKRTRGMTVQNYLVECRLKEACRLLRDTSYTVSRVGQLVGYGNTSYFCAAFLKRYGKTPGEWRRG